MATKIDPGTAFKGPDGQVAVRMAPSVTAYRYFVIHPKNGGHPVDAASPEADDIESWPQGTFPEPPEKAAAADGKDGK